MGQTGHPEQALNVSQEPSRAAVGKRREEEEKIKGGKIISTRGINDRFENEVVKREERKSRKGKQRRLHSICSPQT